MNRTSATRTWEVARRWGWLAIVVAAAGSFPAAAEKPAAPSGPPLIAESAIHLPLRLRLGALGGIFMQKTDPEVGVGFDLVKFGDRLHWVLDATVGVRLTEVTLEPMVGLRLPIGARVVPKLELYGALLAGLNLTIMRGGIAAAVPIRGAVGLTYGFAERLAFGLEFSGEAGPLVAPFLDRYSAFHCSLQLAWSP